MDKKNDFGRNSFGSGQPEMRNGKSKYSDIPYSVNRPADPGGKKKPVSMSSESPKWRTQEQTQQDILSAQSKMKKKESGPSSAARKAWLVVLIAAVACLAWVAVAAASELQEPPHPTLDIEGPLTTPSTEPTETPTAAVTGSGTPEPTPEPTPTPMIPQMQELYEQNSDLAGWIRIDGTIIDYPVMFTPDDGQFYLYRTFQREDDPSKQGCVFIDENCSIDPRSTNLLLHGHNMRNGSMFHSLLEYEDEAFYQEHPTIEYMTLYEQQEYEICYVFRSRVYNTTDDVFKYYKFYNAFTPEEFNNFVAGCEELALYDTGVTPEFGDDILTLNTCEYTAENGRMVVVARRVKPESEAASDTQNASPSPSPTGSAVKASSRPTELDEVKVTNVP